MIWLVFALASVVFWALWGFLGKLSLRDAGWIQVSLFYGLGILLIFGALALALRDRDVGWTAKGTLLCVLTAVAGTAGLVTFYLALDRGKASVVVPIIGIYPILTALLSILFLGERLSTTQFVGVALAGVAVVLIGLGR